ncbi:hypothetical protein Tco_0115771 [Tanacetum coccineum]
MCDNDIPNDQNVVEYDDERVVLANLIANLKLDIDENKKIQKQLKKANASLTQELTECKSILAETSRTLGESIKNLSIWVKHSKDHFRAPTAHDMEILIKTCLMSLALKTRNDSFVFVHELKQEMHADLKYIESLENEMDELESDKAEFSNMYDILLQECVSNDVMCSYLHSLFDLDAHTELQCLYLHKVKECECLAQKLSKQTEFVSKEVYNLKAQPQDKNIAICELKKLIDKCKGKSTEIKFDNPYVVRQPNAQRIPKPSVLGKLAPFSDSLERKNFAKKKSVLKTNESEGMYQIDTRTKQTRASQSPQTYRNTNPHVCTSTGVTLRTNVSRPQFKSNQMKDKAMSNTSQVKFKKTEVEDHHRISSISNKTKSVTACNDSLNPELRILMLFVLPVENVLGLKVKQQGLYSDPIITSINIFDAAVCLSFGRELVRLADVYFFELVNQAWVKHSKDYFRAPTARDMEILIKTCLMPLALKTQNDSFVFVHELKQEMHVDLKYVESIKKEIDELEPDKAKFSNMYDMHLQECVSNDVMCSYLHSLSDLDAHTELQYLYLHKVKECDYLAQKLSKQTEFIRVNQGTNVSRPQLRSNQMKDKVVLHTSQVKFKKTKVEDHHRISSISNQTKSVTTCNDSLKSRTSNVNVVCATCGKYVFNSNHDAYVSKYLNDVNARTKKPNVVPISTRKLKIQANKSVVTPRKKIVASESTDQISKSYYRMLYEKISKAWKWWIE